MTNNTSGPIAELAQLIDAIDIAMLTTTDADGRLESRPMVTQKVPFDGTLWFFASRSSLLTACVMHHPQVNVSYIDHAKQRYVSVTGSANIVENNDKRHELWQSDFVKWFPAGVDDPDITLLRITVSHADFWEVTSKLMVRLVGFAESLLGLEHQDVASSHGRLDW